MSVTINSVKIDLKKADVSIQDHNDMTDSDEFLPMVEVLVWLGKHGFVYQTGTTYDHGMSSKIEINRESGAFDSVQALLEELGAYDENHDDPDEQVYEAGKLIGDALDVQSVFDDYMSEHGTWERGDGMDANTEVFVPKKMTQAEIFAGKLDNDGQKFETDDGVEFDALISEMNADTSYYTSRGSENGELTEQNASDHVDGDIIAYKFDDDSMIVLAGPAWDVYDGNGWDIELPE